MRCILGQVGTLRLESRSTGTRCFDKHTAIIRLPPHELLPRSITPPGFNTTVVLTQIPTMALKVAPREHSFTNVPLVKVPSRTSITFSRLRKVLAPPHSSQCAIWLLISRVASSSCRELYSVRYWTWLSNFALQCDQALLSFAGFCHAAYPCSFRKR